MRDDSTCCVVQGCQVPLQIVHQVQGRRWHSSCFLGEVRQQQPQRVSFVQSANKLSLLLVQFGHAHCVLLMTIFAVATILAGPGHCQVNAWPTADLRMSKCARIHRCPASERWPENMESVETTTRPERLCSVSLLGILYLCFWWSLFGCFLLFIALGQHEVSRKAERKQGRQEGGN